VLDSRKRRGFLGCFSDHQVKPLNIQTC
jgi:hypothetical protein